MKPFIHAKNSANKFGGKPEDYQAIHDFMDSSKAVVPDMRHRAIFHSAFGCFIVEKVFGTTIKNSDGDEVSTRDIAEEHILEDLGMIPTLQDWLNEMQFQDWMMSPELREKKVEFVSPGVPLIERDGSEKERSQMKTTEQDVGNIPNPMQNLVLDGGRPERFDDIPLEMQIKIDAIENSHVNDEIRVVDGKRGHNIPPGKRVLDGRPRRRPISPSDSDSSHIGRGDGKSTFD